MYVTKLTYTRLLMGTSLFDWLVMLTIIILVALILFIGTPRQTQQ